LAPTIEEIRDVVDTVEMETKRQTRPDHNILVLHKSTTKEMLNMLVLIKGDWLQGSNIPFLEFNRRFGLSSGF
ncbi:hypothetical protein HAX54_013048, partial [Datura stramonium]|nr:hypothetical protein [Datura stramonium]